MTHYPLDVRLGGSRSRSGRGDEEKKIPSLPLPGIKRLVFQPVI